MTSTQQPDHSTGPTVRLPDRRPPHGLVHGCISREALSASVSVVPGGLDISNLIRSSVPPAGGTRGIIRGLSAAARRRLLRVLIRLAPPSSGSSFVGLTYHHGHGEDPGRWHTHLDNFLRELRDVYGAFGPEWLWVLEAQQRGAPHFHVLIIWKRAPHPIQFRRWVARTWHRIADPSSPEHAKAGTSCDAVVPDDRRAVRRLTAYLTKYLGKSEQKAFIDKETGELLPSGRMWGKTHTLLLDEQSVVSLTADELAQFARRIRRWGASSSFLRKFGKQFHAGVILGDGAQLAQLLRGLGTDSSPPT